MSIVIALVTSVIEPSVIEIVEAGKKNCDI
jgi:hypothetical protein